MSMPSASGPDGEKSGPMPGGGKKGTGPAAMRSFSIRRAMRVSPILPGALKGCLQTLEVGVRTVVGIPRTLGLEGVELEQGLAPPPLQGGAGPPAGGPCRARTGAGFRRPLRSRLWITRPVAVNFQLIA